MIWRTVTSGVLSVLLCATPVIAQPVSSEWQPVDRLRPGTPVTIILKTGERVEAPLETTTDTALRVTLRQGDELSIAKSDVLMVTARPRDSLRNGTLIGAGVGFGLGFLGHAAFNAKATASGPIWDGEAVGYYAGTGLLAASIGAAIGAVIDVARRKTEIVYPHK